MSSDLLAHADEGARGRQRRQLPEEVASYVRALIFSGAIRPGEFLRLEPIAEALGVSNTPVREGLLSLRSEGLVQLVPRRGFVVAPFDQQDVRDLFWVQAQLAGELAARAAKKMSKETLAQLEQVAERHAQAIADGDRDAISRLGHHFHAVINKAAGSYRLALLLESVVRHLPDEFYAGIEASVAGASNDHPLLLEALRTRNVRQARSVMEAHIESEANNLIAVLEERGLWGEGTESVS
jgi:DNA-binding GntR family transcriptional regulator